MSNKEVIAVVRLQPGQGGYYDELSRVHLTIGNPQANIYAGTNCTQLRRSVKSGRLRLISGSFGPDVPPFQLVRRGDFYVLAHNSENHPIPVKTDAEPVTEPVVPEQPVVAEQPVVPEQPVVAEQPVAEKPEDLPVEVEEKVEDQPEETPEAAADEQKIEKKGKAGKKTAKKDSKKTEQAGE